MSRLSGTKRSETGARINRAPSQIVAHGMPWVTIALASLLSSVVLIASAPVLPPFGFLMFLAWRQLRPGLLPIWAGLPLGAIDDFYSGQPIGSAIMLWSLAAIALDLVEARLPWRNFLTEWLMAIGLILLYILACLGVANMAGAHAPLIVVMPQIVLSVIVYPLVGRFVAALDRLRLRPIVILR